MRRQHRSRTRAKEKAGADLTVQKRSGGRRESSILLGLIRPGSRQYSGVCFTLSESGNINSDENGVRAGSDSIADSVGRLLAVRMDICR